MAEKKKKAYKIMSRIYTVLLFLFIYAPVVIMIIYSFNDNCMLLLQHKQLCYKILIAIFSLSHKELIIFFIVVIRMFILP